ncbi:Cadmium, cobalt and zinc/H(+)-K(+) antiporter [bioreactor metagenome]|uniref:Cadmium, cobalt and zinc/H(+)-K(+) antiporter n=1 Tax=bioreactor metagenome TaxID=1076179 RepID=A0A644TNZ5_9ZZZZ
MHSHHDTQRQGNQKGLAIAAVITTIIMIAEFVGGLVTNSLALLSDSGHMLSDVTSLLVSLFALRLATKPPSLLKPFGYHRFEILAALMNGITLFVIAVLIMIEAYQRFLEPPAVASGAMMVIALIGLLANALSAVALHRQGDVKDNLNMRSAYLHVIGDALGSVGAIIAGLLMYYFQWYIADPIISVVVALVILRGAGRVIQQSAHILMEGAPSNIDPIKVKESLECIDGVTGIHDLRIWTITSGIHSLTCHLSIATSANRQLVLDKATSIVKNDYNFRFCTIQMET